MAIDWKRVLKVDVSGETYSSVNRRINPSSGQMKNFPVKEEIKDIIRDKNNCKPFFDYDSAKKDVQNIEWLCVDDGIETKVRGRFTRGKKLGKKVTKLAEFEVFTEDGEETPRSRNIKVRLVEDFGAKIDFINDDEYKSMIDDIESAARRTRNLDFANDEVFILVDELGDEFGIDDVDAGHMLGIFKGMSKRERHWVTFGNKIGKYERKYGFETKDIKRVFDKIDKSGVQIE